MQRPADLLSSILGLGRRTSVVDIGANPVDSDPPYKKMLSSGLCDLVGFEPQTDALAQLNAKKGPHETYLPYAVGDGEAHTLHICLASGMTSLLEPDPSGLDLFPEFPRWGSVQSKETMPTVRLDDIAEIKEIDFLKIDVQGSELSVFRGGRTKLAKAVAIQTEISFIPLYKNQPPFGEIDIELRSLGFVPHTFAALNRRMLAPLRGATPFEHMNQLMEADIVYVRDFRDMSSMSKDQLGQLAMIAHHVYKSLDLTVRCLVQLAALGSVQSVNIENYINTARSGAFS